MSSQFSDGLPKMLRHRTRNDADRRQHSRHDEIGQKADKRDAFLVIQDNRNRPVSRDKAVDRFVDVHRFLAVCHHADYYESASIQGFPDRSLFCCRLFAGRELTQYRNVSSVDAFPGTNGNARVTDGLYKDDYDLELTCASDVALQAYLSGIQCALCLDAPGIKELTEAITEDEEFALAHAALGRQLLIHGFRKQSSVHLKKALTLRAQATAREQVAIDVVVRTCRADPQAITMAQQHVQTCPQDVFVLSHLLGPFGLLAFSGEYDWAGQNVSLLKATKSAYRADDWWHLTTGGFFAAETGEFSQAREDCERAWSISPNGNCAHSLVHLHFEVSGLDEGKDFINEWLPTWGRESDMRHHMIWHLAFLDLESGVDIDEIFEVYDRELDAAVSDPMPLTTLSDNAAFLWRCLLAGKKASQDSNKDVLAYAEKHYVNCGFYFADVHRAMATAMQTSDAEHKSLLDELHEIAEKRDTPAAASLEVFASGFGAFAKHAYEETVGLLEPVLSDSVLLGGSNPQRRVVEDTYLEACMRSEQYGKARAILQNRNRPTSVFDQRLLEITGS